MELTELGNNQIAFFVPVVLVVLGAICVYVFGFKTAHQPAFDKLSVTDDRKPAGKKRKTKEKVFINCLFIFIVLNYLQIFI